MFKLPNIQLNKQAIQLNNVLKEQIKLKKKKIIVFNASIPHYRQIR